MESQNIVQISAGEVKRLLDFDLVYEGLEEALAIFSKHDNSIVQPLRHIVDVTNHNGLSSPA